MISPDDSKHYTLRHTHRRPPKIRTNYGSQTKRFQVAKILNSTEGLIDFKYNLLQLKKKLKEILVCSDTVLGNLCNFINHIHI